MLPHVLVVIDAPHQNMERHVIKKPAAVAAVARPEGVTQINRLHG
jgi:hypothetical protein